MPNALASNAGDRYHFIYVARRMLDMLHPRSNLTLLSYEYDPGTRRAYILTADGQWR